MGWAIAVARTIWVAIFRLGVNLCFWSYSGLRQQEMEISRFLRVSLYLLIIGYTEGLSQASCRAMLDLWSSDLLRQASGTPVMSICDSPEISPGAVRIEAIASSSPWLPLRRLYGFLFECQVTTVRLQVAFLVSKPSRIMELRAKIVRICANNIYRYSCGAGTTASWNGSWAISHRLCSFS